MASSTRTRSRKRTSSAKVSNTAARIAAAVDKQEAEKPVVKSQPKPVKTVTKYTQIPEKLKVTETPKSATRPEKPNLTWEDYSGDFKVRWQIHQYETQELWKDLVKVYHFSAPYVVKAVDFSVESYNKLSKSLAKLADAKV